LSNSFNKIEMVAFETLLEAFNDALVLSRMVSKYTMGMTEAERQSDVIWRPMPYIARSFDGLDQSANFNDKTQLSVPATLGYLKSSPWIMDSLELRDALQENRLGMAAKQKLASDINVSVLNVASQQGTLVVPIATAAGTYADVAVADAVLNEQGIMMDNRYLALSSRSYNGLASNLAERQTMTGKPTAAYERSYVGEVAGFSTYKMDYANRIAVAAGAGDTIDTTAGAGGQYYTPVATSVAATGERSNVDNRYQQITVSDTTSVVAGDCFTIDDVQSVHHITKGATGQLKTFRVVSVDSGTTMTISPPLITGQGGTEAELMYQNCEVVATSAAASINYINVAAADINCFWRADGIELLPARLAVPTDSGAAVMRGTTDQGIELVMQKQFDIDTSKTKFRVDAFWGVVMTQPEMAGIIIWGQT